MASGAATSKKRKKYAILGAGLAGISSAWHLLKQVPSGTAVELHLIDVTGIAAGGSGAAAGLLHPFSPKCKLLWQGGQAMSAALELIGAAEAALEQTLGRPALTFPSPAGDPAAQPCIGSKPLTDPVQPEPQPWSGLQHPTSARTQQPSPVPQSTPGTSSASHPHPAYTTPFVWRNGVVRIAADARQVNMFTKMWGSGKTHATQQSSADASAPTPSPSQPVATASDASSAATPPLLASVRGPFLTAECLTAARLDAVMPGLVCPSIQPMAAAESDGRPTLSPAYAATKLKHDNKISARERRRGSSNKDSASSNTVGSSSSSSSRGSTSLEPAPTVSQSDPRPAPSGPTSDPQPAVDMPVGVATLDADTTGGLPTAPEEEPVAALFIPDGLVLDVPRYLEALWLSCQVATTQRRNGSSAALLLQHVSSLTELQSRSGPYDAIIVAAGAAVGTLPEIGEQLPLRLCYGETLVMTPPTTASPPDSPALPTTPTARLSLGPHTAGQQQQNLP
ncbi:MAG: hypothetical protein WDW36_002301 [Sanguina aurantia]